MKDLIRYWKVHYYTEPLLCIVLCITLLVSLKNKKKFSSLKYIPLYTITLLLVALCAIYNINRTVIFLFFAHHLDYFFTLLELLIFSHFYYHLINNHPIKKAIILTNLASFILYIYLLLEDKDFHVSISEKTQNIAYTVEGVILLLICLTYLTNIFKKPSYLNLKNDPVFWISTGLFFFLTCTLPFSILENYIDKNYLNSTAWLYSIFYIFYTLLFLMIIRAYLCKPETKT